MQTLMHGVLRSLSLVYNGFTAVPTALRCASGLRDLDMGNQHGVPSCDAADRSTASSAVRIAGLHVLQELRDLHSVRLWFDDEDTALAELRRARPSLVITGTTSRDVHT